MKIQYAGHSSFLLTFEDGTRVVTDPFGDVGIPMPDLSADAVTVSHAHYDHNNVSGVHAPIVLSREGEFTVGGVHISAVGCFHDEVHGAKRGRSLAFRFEAEGISVLHCGDLGEPCSAETVQRLGRADVLLIPVGGNYTIDALEAKRYVDALQPAVAIPMHYKVRGLTVDIAAPERFLSLFSDVVRTDSLTLRERPRGDTKIVFMERSKRW